MLTSATNPENKEYYVYILFRLDKPKGIYTYGSGENQVTFDYEPFYVGKGKGCRIFNHFTYSNILRDQNLNKTFIIETLLKYGFEKEEIGIKFKENLTENKSFNLEIELIKIIGRSDEWREEKIKGPLTNMTDGGDGMCEPSLKTRLLISNNSKNIKPSKEAKQRMSLAQKGKSKNNAAKRKGKIIKTSTFHTAGKGNGMYGKTGSLCPFFNKKHTDANKKLLSELKKGKHTGKDNVNWEHEYKITNLLTKEIFITDKLKNFCMKNDMVYSSAKAAFRFKRYYKFWSIEKNN